jgi:hypothetical protein
MLRENGMWKKFIALKILSFKSIQILELKNKTHKIIHMNPYLRTRSMKFARPTKNNLSILVRIIMAQIAECHLEMKKYTI